MKLVRRQYGIGFGLPHERKFFLTLYTGTVFRQIAFHWNVRIKGFKCYTYHYAMNDEVSIQNGLDSCKLFIGITINK